MRKVGISWICAGLLLALGASPAEADVLVLQRDGEVRRSKVGSVSSFGPRAERKTNRRVRRSADRRKRRSDDRRPVASTSARKRKRKRRTVLRELRRMYEAGAIDDAEFAERREAYRSAKEFVKRLPEGRRRIEMAAAVRLLDRMAERGRLTVGRLHALWLTLQANREWWSEGPLLASGRRVGFEGSELVWQYVAYQGLQIHPLANFGKLNALWRSKRRSREAPLGRLLDELLALAAERSGGLAWEYYFDYGGGRAPWVSGMAQATGLQSMARAATRLGRQEEVLPVARRGLSVFEQRPPHGVRQPVGGGSHYLLYSFNPRLRVINGFMQALVGLWDFASVAGDERARSLFEEGDQAARRELPHYDTGAWSLYSRVAVSRESDLGYHQLVTGFLENLCERTGTPVYCRTGERFALYLEQPPELELISTRQRGGTVSRLRFRLSKISRVSVWIGRGDSTVLARSLTLAGGRRYLTWTVPRRPGEYDVRITAVDLAGNKGTLEGLIDVLKPRRRRS